jgi:hypothetical protein
LSYGGFGWSSGRGFQTVNDWTVIPGVGNYTNLERGVKIPGSTLKGARFTSSRKPCLANPAFCTNGPYTSNWSGVYLNSKACYKYGQFNITMASKNTNAYQFIAWIQTHSRNPW